MTQRSFLIFFQIFFIITVDVGGGRNLSALFEMKLNQEINWAWNQKILIFLVWCDNFWDTFTLGTTSNKKLYDQKLSQNICRRLPEPQLWYSLILEKMQILFCKSAVFKKIDFTKDAFIAIYRIFLNSWRVRVSGCRGFSSCAVIVIYILCTFTFFKDTLDTKSTNLTKNWLPPIVYLLLNFSTVWLTLKL